jgi:membrane protein required for colicin V production
MSGADWLIVAALALSVLLGIARGVVREMLALAGWIFGIVVALQFAEPIGSRLPMDWPILLKTALAAVFIVVGALLIAALIGAGLRALLAAAKLKLEDRLLGGIFGLVRGVLMVGLAVLIAAAVDAPSQSWWQQSSLLPWAQAGVRFASPWLPGPLAALAERGR